MCDVIGSIQCFVIKIDGWLILLFIVYICLCWLVIFLSYDEGVNVSYCCRCVTLKIGFFLSDWVRTC